LAIECRRRIDADATVAVLDRLVALRAGAPQHIRCDNGPELTANALRDWCRFSGAGSAYIDPGSPWQNPYVESFGSRVRDELLGVELFSCLAEAKVMVEDWRCDYNERRPHSALGMSAPARFARSWRQGHENGQPITLGDPAQARRTPQNAPISITSEPTTPDHRLGDDQAALTISLRSPSGLPPRDGDTTLQHQPDHRLSQQVDR
jgi:putative transposase